MSSQLNVSIQMQLCTVCMSSLLSVVAYPLHETRGEQTLTYPETTTAITLGGTKGSRWLLVSLTVGTSNFCSTTGVNRVNNNATHITSHTHTASCTYTKHTHTTTGSVHSLPHSFLDTTRGTRTRTYHRLDASTRRLTLNRSTHTYH